jgi:WD40 repeat protein
VRTGTAKEAAGALASRPIRLSFSPDGKTVVSTNIDGSVTLWNAAAATPSETLRGHSGTVWESVFSADGATLYTGSSDGTVIAWDLSGDRRLGRRFTFTHDRGLSGWPDRHPGKFSPDGRLIAVGLKAEGVELRGTGDPSRHSKRLQPTGGEVTALAFSLDGRTLAAVTKVGMATIWDLESGSLRQGPFQVAAYAVGVSISVDGTMLATAGEYGVNLWDVATGAFLGSIGDGRNAGDVAFSPTEPLVAFVVDGYLQSGGGDAEIWDVARRSLVTTLHIDDADVLGWAVAFSADGRMLATSGIDPLVHLWDVRSGKLIREFEQNVGNAVWALEFTPDGRTLAISGGDSFASLWDVATGAQIGPRLGAGSRESMLDLSPDGRDLLITSGNGQAAIWGIDPESWPQRACALANRTLTHEEWDEFLPGRPYEPACQE